MRLLLLASCAACGRLDFNATSDAQPDRQGDSSPADAQPIACGQAATVPDTVTVAGQTFNYTDFDNTHTALPSVDVAVIDASASVRLIRR